jgi:manganese peroxidase
VHQPSPYSICCLAECNCYHCTRAGSPGGVEPPLSIGSGNNTGKMRLQSNFALAYDTRTACFWQGFVNQQAFMTSRPELVITKLVLGRNHNALIYCSDVVPASSMAAVRPASLPAPNSPSLSYRTLNSIFHPFYNI